MHIQQQKGASDFGLFAIATASKATSKDVAVDI